MPGGAQRQANVEMLVEKARAFEGTSYKGLFNFVRYIEQLKKYDVDYVVIFQDALVNNQISDSLKKIFSNEEYGVYQVK